MSAISEKRYGKFSIPRELIEDDLAQHIYKDMIPVRVELDFCTDSFEVTAAHPDFEPRSSNKSGTWGPVPFYEYDLCFDPAKRTDITGVVIGIQQKFRGIVWKKRE